MSLARDRQVDRIARTLFAELRSSRTTRFETSDPTFQRDVVTRLNQLMAGDTMPITSVDADD